MVGIFLRLLWVDSEEEPVSLGEYDGVKGWPKGKHIKKMHLEL